MRKLAPGLAGVLILTMVTGCSNVGDRRWGRCAVAGGLLGALAGGAAGGAAADPLTNHTGNDTKAAGAGIGFASGALIGAVIGHFVCDEVAQAAPAPPPPPPPPPPAKGTKLGTVGEAYFDFDKAEIKAHDGRGVLDDVVKTMRDNPSLRVSVEGHTDSIGSDAYNQRLSERRAGAVKRYLMAQGIASSRVDAEGFGKKRPVADNKTTAGRAKNRRADIIAE